MSVTKLKKELKAAQKANKAAMDAAVEKAMLENQLALESSTELFESKVSLAVVSGYTAKLELIIATCKATIDGTPIENKKTKAPREWAGKLRFNYNNQIDLMHQIVTGINYSCNDHKQLLLTYTKLNSEMVEQFINAFGSPMYYSRNYNTIVPAVPYNVEKLKAVMTLMQSTFGVVIDMSCITEENLKKEFDNGAIRANTDKLEAEEAIAKADLDMAI